MTNKTCNGWSNYATWRAHLEMFNDIALDDFGDVVDKFVDDNEVRVCIDLYHLAQALGERAEHLIECSSKPGLARDYAMAFLHEVNYVEIAEHLIDNYNEEA